MAIAMAMGVWLGMGLGDGSSGGNSEQWYKINEIMQYVEHDYVDTVSRQSLEEEVLAYLLQRLDPHSYYISEDDVAAMNEPLEGGFEGIGIQFNIDNDTIYVINTIAGGPSQKAGIQPGDRIIGVDGEYIAGKGLSNKQVMSLLKGPSGSEVAVEVLRQSLNQTLNFDIIRGEIPLNSLDAAYRMNDSTIYVRLARFAKTTYSEFKETVYPLKNGKVKHFILDLRGNGGGFLDAAVDLADEFLADDLIITYTEGKSRPRTEYFATGKGKFEDTRLYVLIDRYSASASEIFAGAVQDHGRGLIIGKRSFGKGLVQEQNEWSDGSATRLTVARYYTPNGRSIQRPYDSLSDLEAYYNPDSAAAEQGGISPDVYVKNDTAGVTWLYAELVHRALITDFVYDYRDRHYEALKELSTDNFIERVTDDTVLSGLRAYLVQREFEINENEWVRSAPYMATRCRALMARSLFNDQAYYRIFNPSDATVKAALQAIKKPSLSGSV